MTQSIDEGRKRQIEKALDSAIPISQLKQKLLKRVKMTPRRSFFIWGPPGIGKSSIIYQTGTLLNAAVFEVRLGYHDPVDLRGIPVPVVKLNSGIKAYLTQPQSFNVKDVVGGVTEWFIPDFLCFPTDQLVLLFLDEFNQADRAVQKVAQQMVLDYKLGDYKFPENVRVIAAGNREEDRAFVQKMAAPTANRFIHYDATADADGWLDWAVTNNIHPIVAAYIKFSPLSLFNFDPKSNNRSFPTPRSWEFVSDILKDGFDDGDNDFHDIMGCVGKGEAIQFIAFRDMFNNIPDFNEIFKNPATAPIPSNPSIAFSVCITLARKADWKNLGAIKTYTERLGREHCAYTIHYIEQLNEALSETSEFVVWANEYANDFVDERIIKVRKRSKNK